ncbi:Mn-dependent transcriptional regulator MntR [hydrothermal vent metagenome]|uniref:Manganese transport regulator n=1 Tax=hydrothermal vent metagenome TaxID=652676 RepID=A0A3B1E2K2_9ZZZZ
MSPPPSSALTPDAARHARVRDAHSAEMAEDYVETIADTIAERGTCRVRDLSTRFGVSHVTVSRTVGRLVRDGLATTEPYKPICLTPKGKRLALKAKARHQTCVRFLLALGLDRKTAEIDAEGIEHHVSPKTLKLFDRFADEHRRKPSRG